MATSRAVKVDETVDSPGILLDAENSVFNIEGSSYPEDAYDVYDCVLDWIKENDYKFENKLICNFKYRVLSSASRKLLYDIFLSLEKASKNSPGIEIHWHHEKFDEDILEVGQDFDELLDLPFKFIAY